LNRSSNPELYVALVHFPVINKNGETITSAVTNLDLHDIARASRTYGVRQFYVITPLEDQKNLGRKILTHWISGSGAAHNRIRGDALEVVRIRDSVEIMLAEIQAESGRAARTVVTSARKNPRAIPYPSLKQELKTGIPHALLFGTAWGLSPEIMENADLVLEPIMAGSDYNHLSVRSAVSITLDRLIYEENIPE
jgi:hypothetical protein